MTTLAAQLGDAFTAHQRYLWGLCYRMTGCAADADDLVQDTFARAMQKPPQRADIPLRPWLVRVAMNLSRDALRRRRRSGYVGTWLPSPIEPASYELVGDDKPNTAGRYDLLESVSFAFLLALEVLTPQQRAVLLLRDVFDYSVRETAGALDIGESNVKTTLHRARRKLREYEQSRCIPTQQEQARCRAAMEQLFRALAAEDMPAMEKLLAADVRALSDGGGEYFAARVPVVGRAKVAHFYSKIARMRGAPVGLELRTMNGFPALIAHFAPARDKDAPAVVTTIILNKNNEIAVIHSVLASRKLSRVQPGS